jgi:hypothetical protein
MASNGAEYRVILAPMSDAGLLKKFTFTDTITSTSSQIVGLKDQSDFSLAAGSAGELDIDNTPGVNFSLSPGHETGGPAAIAPAKAVTTSVTGTGSAGVSSVELGYLLDAGPVRALADAVTVPEPSSWGLLALGLAGLRLLRKQSA